MTKLEKLQERLEQLEDKLYEAELKENEQWNRIGFGAGMRRSKITNCTFMRSVRLREQIEKVKEQIKQLKSKQP